MTDAAPEPGGDAPAFDAPWQARAFAVAVALTDDEDLAWTDFQSRLVEEIQSAGDAAGDREEVVAAGADHEETYYRRWLAALERLLVEDDLLEPGALLERVQAFERGDRTAHEFVRGDPHAHADRLPEGHAEGSAHDHGGHGHGHHDHDDRSHDHGHGDGHSHADHDHGDGHDHGHHDGHDQR